MRSFLFCLQEILAIVFAAGSAVMTIVFIGLTIDNWPDDTGIGIAMATIFAAKALGSSVVARVLHLRAGQGRAEGGGLLAPVGASLGFAPASGGHAVVALTLAQPLLLDFATIPELEMMGQVGHERIAVQAQVVRMPTESGAAPTIAVSRAGNVLAELGANNPNYPVLFPYIGATLNLDFFLVQAPAANQGASFDYRMSALV